MAAFSFAEHVAFPGPEVCGTGWADSYARLHAGIRAGRLPARYITWSCEGVGLGDNLVGLASVFVAALLMERAIILANHHLETVFEPAEVDWRWHTTRDVPMHDTYSCRRQECRNHMVPEQEGRARGVLNVDLRNGRPAVNGSTVQFPVDVLGFFRPLENYTNLRVWTNGGILTRVFHSDGATRRGLELRGLRAAVAFPCIVRYLLRPNQILLKSAQDNYHRIAPAAPPSVCVHLRSVDDFDQLPAAQQAEDFAVLREGLLECGKNIAERVWPNGNRTWLLTADSQMLKSMASRWAESQKIHMTMTFLRPKHYERGGAASTVIEWLLFTLCELYVVPQSGFSKSAFAYSLRNPLVYLIPRLDEEYWGLKTPGKGICPTAPASVIDLEAWSGL